MEPLVGRRGERKEPPRRRQASRRRPFNAQDADAASSGEFVGLAAALDRCVAFNPKQWRRALEKSVSVLQNSRSEAAQDGLRHTRHKSKGGARKLPADTLPVSRDEDVQGPRGGVFPPLSLSQYLNQPDLVKAILTGEEDQRQQVAESEDPDAVEADREFQGRGEMSEEQPDFDDETQRTEDEDGNKEIVEKRLPLALPLLTTMSPRTRRGLAKLPSPSEAEMRNIERVVDQPELSFDFYREMRRAQMKQARQQNGMRVVLPHTTPLQELSKSLAVPVASMPKTKIMRGADGTSKMKKKNGLQSSLHTGVADVTKSRAREYDELQRMKREDARNYDTFTYEMEPNQFGAVLSPSRNHGGKRNCTYKRLIHEQQTAISQHGAAEYQVKTTIAEIRQWVPLDVVYAVGLGKFASPAQQRAAEVLFRVGTRLKNQLLSQGMAHWKDWVCAMQQQEGELSTLRLQCWWRQIIARRELAMRKMIKEELQRRQQRLLALLASKQQQAACSITRCIRRYAGQCYKVRVKAAVRIQIFWRKLCAQWAALRREILRQRRLNAAVCIQKHARRIAAQRKRCLLKKIKNAETRRRQKALELATFAKNTMLLGAAITIQRVVRGWRQRRILMLRRRRAAFENDKQRILKVQAHYRGRQARKRVTQYKLDVSKAVLVLQCCWRSYRATCEFRRRNQYKINRREQVLKEIEERHRSKQTSILSPVQLQRKWGQFPLLKGTNASRPGEGSTLREVRAARKLQALWRGKQIRQRLRHEKARDAELLRRKVNRKRRLAAVCIQKRVRGIRGRARAWRTMEETSAIRIQRVWRGYNTRTRLLKMRAGIDIIKRIQVRWRNKQHAENHRLRARNASTIQRAARKFIGKRMLSLAVRRRQFLAEESAVGKLFVERTRSRIKDELLLQSFTFKELQQVEEKKQRQRHDVFTKDQRRREDSTRVDRSLFDVDIAKKQWKRKGYDGVWQEVYRNAAGNSLEMDNSHFARFLKALPHAFIHKSHFPMQTADVIFAKMKEPKAKTISFSRFNKAILMLLKEKFTDGSSHKEKSKGSEPGDLGSDHERYLRFMNRFVLPSTIQNGKYRKTLDVHCTHRLLWSVAVLRRLAIRIATKKRHDEFVIAFKEQQRLKYRSECAAKIQLAYRCYKFRLQLKKILASMFIEFIDHAGRAVRLQHIASGKILSKRPAFLKGVVCGKIIPLPFPGEEFQAFCERHEDSTNLDASRVPAEVYCVECEDTMCRVCFDRDHTVRKAFRRHQIRKIQNCSYCSLETATKECLQCGDGKVPFCDPCFSHVHQQLLREAMRGQNQSNEDAKALVDQRRLHKFQALVVMCVECSDRVAQWSCETCLDIFCKRCMSSYHAKGQRQYHHCHRLNYFSVLRQTAEQKRSTDAEKEQERRKKRRDEERRHQEAELRRQNLAATKIQAVVRSFVGRRKGKAYMKLVRQTQAARAQRLKDQRVRASIAYKVKTALGVSPTLKSDTARETAARRQRFDDIKRTLLLQRLPFDMDPAKKRWGERQKARALEAAKSWCEYDTQVKIVRGEWKDRIGSIVSTQNLMLTGSVVIFIPLANRSVVLRLEDIKPHEESRQPYEPPQEVALNMTRDFNAKISQVLDTAARNARLLYLQTIEFNDITQYAWVAEYDQREQKEEYWNVVLNKRVSEPPKAMQLIELMEQDQREKLEKRVALARSKLMALLNPFHPTNKPKLALRRNAVVFVPAGLVVADLNASSASLKLEMEAIDGARFWHDKVVPNRQFGGKKAKKFLAVSDSKACWSVVKLFYWIDLNETEGFELHAKKLFNLAEDLQIYVTNAIDEKLDNTGDFKLAKDQLVQLVNLETASLQLLATKDQREADDEKSRQAR